LENYDDQDTDIYHAVDMSISCISLGYTNARIYAIFMIFVYPIGFQLAYYIMLYTHRNDIQLIATDTETKQNFIMEIEKVQDVESSDQNTIISMTSSDSSHMLRGKRTLLRKILGIRFVPYLHRLVS
jgi:hypothetical protein